MLVLWELYTISLSKSLGSYLCVSLKIVKWITRVGRVDISIIYLVLHTSLSSAFL